MIAKADIVMENFRPGTMDKLGRGYAVLQAVNPRLIYTAISGFGQTGPHSRRPAYDSTAQAAGGLGSMNGNPGEPPLRVGSIIGDLAASLYATIGTLASPNPPADAGAIGRCTGGRKAIVAALARAKPMRQTKADPTQHRALRRQRGARPCRALQQPMASDHSDRR